MNWSIRPIDPVTATNELDLRINAHELQSGERMADAVKRGVLLKSLAPLPEGQKHVMKDSARLKFCKRWIFFVWKPRSRCPLDVDGAPTGNKGKGKTKRKGHPDDQKSNGKAKRKGKKSKETRVCHECN